MHLSKNITILIILSCSALFGFINNGAFLDGNPGLRDIHPVDHPTTLKEMRDGVSFLRNQQVNDFPHAPKGIIMGNGWSPEKRELDEVFAEQDTLVIGDTNAVTVQFWTEIVNCQDREFTWIVEYETGLRQEIFSQKIRYERFRTYMEKTFRKSLWNKETNTSENVTGLCKVLIVDKNNADEIIVEKSFVLK